MNSHEDFGTANTSWGLTQEHFLCTVCANQALKGVGTEKLVSSLPEGLLATEQRGQD